MIPVERPPAPPDFEEHCGGPGRAWLACHPNRSPHANPLWTRFTPALREHFQRRCGFLAMYLHRGTVDHWVSLRSDRTKAYDWENLRFVDGGVNSAKKPSWEGRLLDPYEIQPGWFELLLPSLQLVVADVPDEATRIRAEFTLDKLGLRDGEDVVRLRREWLDQYEQGHLTMEGLRRFAPLVARAVEKRGG